MATNTIPAKLTNIINEPYWPILLIHIFLLTKHQLVGDSVKDFATLPQAVAASSSCSWRHPEVLIGAQEMLIQTLHHQHPSTTDTHTCTHTQFCYTYKKY